MAEGTGPSVIFRPGRPTAADYDEAIDLLTAARGQLEPDGRGCAVCHDSGHQAWECHHNPLVVAREAHFDQAYWICFHCGLEFSQAEYAAAEEHFGKTPEGVADCVRAWPAIPEEATPPPQPQETAQRGEA